MSNILFLIKHDFKIKFSFSKKINLIINFFLHFSIEYYFDRRKAISLSRVMRKTEYETIFKHLTYSYHCLCSIL